MSRTDLRARVVWSASKATPTARANQPRLDGGRTWHASMAHLDSVSPRKAKAEPSGEENHCIQFGLASGEQRWGIEGASVWSSIGQFALDNVSR